MVGFILLSSFVYGLDAKEFKKLIAEIQEKKFVGVESFLQKNEKTLQQDPEYYVVLLNYVLSKGDLSGVVISKDKPKEGEISLQDQKTGETVGVIGHQERYDEKLVLDGILKTQNALQFFKERLDIRFGLVTAAEKIKRWDILGDQLVETLKVSKDIDNKWSWGLINSMSENPKEFMLENIQTRTLSLFNVDTPAADDAMLRLSKTMISCYPDVIYGYSNLGVLHLAKKEYAKAEEYLNKALKIDPKDEIVKGNMELLKKSRKD